MTVTLRISTALAAVAGVLAATAATPASAQD